MVPNRWLTQQLIALLDARTARWRLLQKSIEVERHHEEMFSEGLEGIPT